MPHAWIDITHGTIRLQSQTLHIDGGDYDPTSGETTPVHRIIPLLDLDFLTYSESISLTTPALAALMQHQIPVHLISHNGAEHLGSFTPTTPLHSLWRLKQYQNQLLPDTQLLFAIPTIQAKIHNQRRSLQRLALSRQSPLPHALNSLQNTLNQSSRATTPAQLLGHEGSASATWFHHWASFLPPEFPFEKRSRRPPLNPVNAILSYTASILYHEMTALLYSIGLDPGLSYLHTVENNRASLALDLIEPFRPLIVEPLALDLLSRKILQPKHFHPQEGGTYLTPSGRKKLILHYEQRLLREFLSEHRNHRTTLRQQLIHDATTYKSSLHSPSSFSPFRMN